MARMLSTLWGCLLAAEAERYEQGVTTPPPSQRLDMPGDVDLPREELRAEEQRAMDEAMEISHLEWRLMPRLLMRENGEPLTWDERQELRGVLEYEFEFLADRRRYLHRMWNSMPLDGTPHSLEMPYFGEDENYRFGNGPQAETDAEDFISDDGMESAASDEDQFSDGGTDP